MKKKLIVAAFALFFLAILGPLPVGYYYVRNKVLAHHSHGLIKADDYIVVNWFRWWPKAMEIGIYLANPGGAIHMPPNYTETLTSNLVGKKNVALTFDGPCTITQGAFIVQVPQGADDFSITSPFVHSSDQGGNAQGCTFQGYTGVTAAFDIGSSAGFTYNTLIRGIHVNLASAQANAIGIRRTNEVGGPLEYDEVVFGPVSGQIGFQFVGTGVLFDGTSNIIGPECNSSASATNNKCLQWTGVNQNGYAVLGGHANMGGSANGSVCFDAAAGTSGVDPGGFDCDVAATAVTVESTSNTGIRGWMRVDSGVTALANFAAGSNGNMLWVNTRSIGSQLVTDNGTAGTNSVINGFDNQTNSRIWKIAANSTAWQLLDNPNNCVRVLATPGPNGQLRLSACGIEQLYFNFDGGTGGAVFYDGAGNPKLTIDQAGTVHPSVVNTIGLGTTALPFVNIKVGNAATNNTTWGPAVTAARTLTSPDGNSSTVMPFNFTTTAAATDNVTVTGMTASGHCTLTPTNTAAAAGIASVFISAKAANQITVTHTATANWTFDGLCTSN